MISGNASSRLVEAYSDALIAAYESQIVKLETEKVALREAAANRGGPQRSFDEMFRTACVLLANPWKLWVSPQHEHKRLLLRLSFSGAFDHRKEDGFRTAKSALLFKCLAGKSDQKFGVVEPRGVEPLTS